MFKFLSCLLWRVYNRLAEIPAQNKRSRYMRSDVWEKDKQLFRERTGFDFNNPIFKEYKYVAVNGGKGYYFHPDKKGKKFQPVKGKIVEVG